MPHVFNQKLPASMRGEEKLTRSVNGSTQNKYWYYESIVPEEAQPEELLNELIESYSIYLKDLDILEDDLIKYASIVGRFNTIDQIRGFFISKALIKTCSSKGFEIDIDLYDG